MRSFRRSSLCMNASGCEMKPEDAAILRRRFPLIQNPSAGSAIEHTGCAGTHSVAKLWRSETELT